MKKKIFLNGKFLTRPLSGVQRSAYEFIKALDDLIDKGIINCKDNSFVLIYSGDLINPVELKHIQLLKKGVFKGNMWEQIELPIYSEGHLLVSLCSISTIFKSKQILIVHDASFFVNKRFFSRAFRTWYKIAIPHIAKICRQIITVSNFSKNELIKYGKIDENKISIIYNSAEHILKFQEPKAEFKLKVKSLTPYCLSVSNMAANKNFNALCEAIRKVDFADFKMVIAGGEMRTLKYAPPDEIATYLGYVSNNELKYLYSNASLFIFPSFYEGFGIPPLEAMILGCPVIASKTSSMPEILGVACEYFDPHDVNDMAYKIQSLLNNSEQLNRLKDYGYKQAKLYSWTQSALKLYDIIEKYND